MRFPELNLWAIVIVSLIKLGKLQKMVGHATVSKRSFIYYTGVGQDLPDGLDPQVLLDYLDKRVENFCPSGIDRCECVQAPGL